MITLGRTNLEVFEICLGGNVFGWTIDETQARSVLDAYAAVGGNFIDTANVYKGEHGESEAIIGRWMADRGCRDQIVIATKVGGGSGDAGNLKPETIEREAQSSLDRLQTDHIDLYYAHYDDESTEPVKPGETLRVRN
jgi:aryl-alcohol dehydrogenase (NADP+)